LTHILDWILEIVRTYMKYDFIGSAPSLSCYVYWSTNTDMGYIVLYKDADFWFVN